MAYGLESFGGREALLSTLTDLSPQSEHNPSLAQMQMSQLQANPPYDNEMQYEMHRRLREMERHYQQLLMDGNRRWAEINSLNNVLRVRERELYDESGRKKKQKPRKVSGFERGVKWGVPMLAIILLALKLFT